MNPRPQSVTSGAWCMGLALAIGVAILLYGWREAMVAWVCLVFVGALIVLAARRHNWARWTLLVVTLLSFVFGWSFTRFQLSYGGPIAIGTALQLVLEVAGIVLLVSDSARRWYRRTAAPAS